jgi:hypothetical protein
VRFDRRAGVAVAYDMRRAFLRDAEIAPKESSAQVDYPELSTMQLVERRGLEI